MNLKNKVFLILAVAIAQSSISFSLELTAKVRTDKYQTVEVKARSAAQDRSRGVVYLTTSEERESYRVVIDHGIVYNSQGLQYPDSVNTKHGHINHINYVMDDNGNFYIFDEYATPEIRHSSILAGRPVAGAGEIIIKDSHVTYIDADSGHYDSESLMTDVFLELSTDGVNVGPLENENP